MLSGVSPQAFCVWLLSFLEETGVRALTPAETTLIREFLSAVFQHDIDPRMGTLSHQLMLNGIHSGAHERSEPAPRGPGD